MSAVDLRGQECANRYTSIVYKAPTFHSYRTAISTANNEIIAAGGVYKDNAMLAKFSSKGSPIWSYQYLVPYQGNFTFYFDLRFNSIVEASDGNFLTAGYYTRFKGDTTIIAFVAKIDRYGLIKWSKGFQSVYGKNLSVTNLIETNDHDIVLYLAADNGIKNFSYGKVVRLSPDGNLKWSTNLFTNMFDAPRTRDTRRGLIQARNGDIVVGDVVCEIDRSKPDLAIKESDLHFFALNYATGKMKWETSYEYPRPANYQEFTPEITGVIEQADGKFKFFTTLLMKSASQPSENLKPFSIVTDATGHLETVKAYITPEDVHCNIMSVEKNKTTGEHQFLLSRNGTAVLTRLAANGQVIDATGYENSNGLYPPNCMTTRNGSFAIFMANFNDWNTRLLLTDEKGKIDCKNTPATVTQDNADLHYRMFNVAMDVDNSFKDPFEYGNIALTSTRFDLESKIDCEEVMDCCKDVIDSLNIPRIDICEGSTYRLPDNTIVSDSGRYYATFKTTRGCDSIRFYNVHVVKDPTRLSLGNDTCMQQPTQALLHATLGYENYNWMGISSPDPTYSISQPGKYWVKVQNTCGSKTDTVEVFRECEFPIYLPNAFSPNKDNLNDLFIVPALNRNKFIRLTIFNRWGQAVFQTRDQGKGWDGKLKGVLLDAGVFIYYLEMQTLDGKKLSKKGTVTLVR